MSVSHYARRVLMMSAAACLAGGLLPAGPAAAADFGGDCCADLEERVAELEATTVRKGNRKVSLFIYGEVNQAVMFWDDDAESNAYVVSNSTTKTKAGFEGLAQINSEWSAGYRIELDLKSAPSEELDQGFAFGTSTLDIGGGTFISDQVVRVNGFGDDSQLNPITIRHANWFIKSNRLGKITVGQGSQATDGIAEIDLSGATAVAASAVEAWNEGYFLRDENAFMPTTLTRSSLTLIADDINRGVGGFSTFTLYADLFIGNMDGGRGNFIHYTSPTLAGFTFSAAWGEDDDWDVALRYAGTWGEFDVAGGIGYRDGVTIDTETLVALNPAAEIQQKAIVGSGSVVHRPSGVFVSLAAGRTDYDEFKIADPQALPANFTGFDLLDAKYFYVKGGLFRKFFALGKTSIYGEYYKAWDVGSSPSTSPFISSGLPDSVFDEESHVYGFGIVQHIDAAAMELYIAYRHYEANDITDFWTGEDFDIEMDAVMTGGRIRF